MPPKSAKSQPARKGFSEMRNLLLTLNDGIRDERYYGDKRGFQLEDAVVVCWGYRDPKPIRTTDREDDEGVLALTGGQRSDLARKRFATAKDLNQFLNGEKSLVETEAECRLKKQKFSSTIPFELMQNFMVATSVTKRTPRTDENNNFSNTGNDDGSSSCPALCDDVSSILMGDDSSELRIVEEQHKNAKKQIIIHHEDADSETGSDDDDEFFASIRRKRMQNNINNSDDGAAVANLESGRIRNRPDDDDENSQEEMSDGFTSAKVNEKNNLEMPTKFRMVCPKPSSSEQNTHHQSLLERNVDLVETRVPIFVNRIHQRRQQAGEQEERNQDIVQKCIEICDLKRAQTDGAVVKNHKLKNSLQDFARKHRKSDVLLEALMISL